MLRFLFERFLLTHWRSPGLRIRYWDGREVTVGVPPVAFTLHVRSPSVLREMLRHPSLGFGHAYVDGRLALDGNLQEFLRAATTLGRQRPARLHRLLYGLSGLLPRPASSAAAEANARFHYETGNAFFRAWLDPSLTYSCAYFAHEENDLATAQEQKRELICRKLDLQRGMTILDVGCGWGSLLFHAIERYGVRGVGITPSREQARFVEAEARRRGIADHLTLHVADWRSVGGTYDRVVSVGMFEHVGARHGHKFHHKWAEWLKPGGVSVLHTIGGMQSLPADPWITENIFPGAYLPSLTELASHAAAAGLVVADVENLWRHYALTLAAWSKNFAARRQEILKILTEHAPEIPARPSVTAASRAEWAERFSRMWWLYLQSSEAGFRAGRLLLWQLVLTHGKRVTQPLTREPWTLGR